MATPTRRVLIVDDNPVDRETFRRFLKEAGANFQILEADGGEEGLEIALRERPECILLDYNMPDLDGLEFLKEFNERKDEKLDAVVMLTGVGDERVAVEAMKRGVQDYLPKGGVSAGELRRAIESALGKVALQRKLVQQKLELEQFAHICAHDLKEPLRTVAAFSDLLCQTYSGQLDEQADEWLELITSGTRRMQQLIDDLLSWTRIEPESAGRRESDASAALDDALLALHSAITDSKAAVQADALPTVPVNHSQMVQVFQNLIGNAIKFRGDSPPEIRVRCEQTDDEFRFAVADNGIGIAPKFQEAVFAVFRRLHPESRYPGTGIGLAICQRIVELHGGHIRVESAPESGSTFHFTVPVIRLEEAES